MVKPDFQFERTCLRGKRMIIRVYAAGDRKPVVGLWNDVFPNSTGHNEPEFAIDKKLAVDDDLFFVAVEGDSIVGTIMAGYDGHRGWIYSVAVDKSFRRQAIGSRLVQHALSALAAIGCPKVNLQVRTDNAEVAAFYTSLGFLTEERLSMGKRLND